MHTTPKTIPVYKVCRKKLLPELFMMFGLNFARLIGTLRTRADAAKIV